MLNVNILNIEDKIENIEYILAHTNKIKRNETLLEHSKLTLNYFDNLCKSKRLDKVIIKCVNNLIEDKELNNNKVKNMISTMFVNAIYLHDIGKINPKFQKYKMNNEILQYKRLLGNENHSLLSALIYIYLYSDIIDSQFEKQQEKKLLKNVLYKFGYIISRHHSYLDNTGNFIKSLQDLQEEIIYIEGKMGRQGYLKHFTDVDGLINFKIHNTFSYDDTLFINYESMYILTKLLFSSMTNCDFYATTEYMVGLKPQFNTINNINDLLEKYEKQNVSKSIMKYKNNRNLLNKNDINKYRSDMFLEAENNLLQNLDKNIFYLESPTGSGKTNTSINLALKTMKHNQDINKLFYISPFNTVGVQTYNILKSIFGNNLDVKAINSCTRIDFNEEDNDYAKIYSDRQHLHYPCVSTSHIRFFQWLKGINRDDLFPLLQLCNSVVILDEIQSYRNDKWTEIIVLLHKYAELLNLKIIIMSATLPKLDNLLKNKNDIFVDLIKNKRYYYDSDVFKNRVISDFSMLDVKFNSLDTLADEIVEKINSTVVTNKKTGKRLGKKVLIEFIKKNTANEFYDVITKKINDIYIDKITNDEKGQTKQNIIDKFNNSNDIILIATQCIEAGVDLDANIGFKDFSMIDSEEQFIGRVNRSFLKDGSKVYFFNYDNMNHYKGDLRKEINISDEAFRGFLINKDFSNYYKNVFKKILDHKNKLCNENNIEQFNQHIKCSNYKAIDEYIILIENKNTYQIFLNHKIDINENGEYIEINGSDVWNRIKELKNNKYEDDYCKTQVELIQAYSIMNQFVYTCYYNKGNEEPMIYDDILNNTYYIDNGGRYITEDGRLNRQLLEKEVVGRDIDLFI